MPSNSFRAGDLIAEKYVFERVIGEGSVGYVIAATQLNLDECVAIKFLHPHTLLSPDAVARFSREARAAVRIKSEHCVRVLDVGTLPDGLPFLVMEYLEGRDLRSALGQAGTFSPEEATAYVLQACEALAIAHARGIIHRDVKPENLFLAERDGHEVLKVLDFGISKAALIPMGGDLPPIQTLTLLGTPLYMSPEQILATESVDHRADIWSLGIVLYELLSGTTPFAATSANGALHRVVNTEPTPLTQHRSDLPADLIATVNRCLQKNPELRFANMGELAEALLPYANDYGHHCAERALLASVRSAPTLSDTPISSSVPKRLSTRSEQRRRQKRKRTGLWIGAAIAATAAALGAGAFFVGPFMKSRQANAAAVAAAKKPLPVAPIAPPAPPVRGITNNEVLLGMSGAFSGPAKELGAKMKLGVETALMAANDEGGVHGRSLKLVALDDGYDAEKTLAAMKELLERRNVFAFVGNIGTPTAAVAMPYAVENKTLFYGAFTGAALLRQDPPDRYVINFRASYEEETAKIVKYLVENKHLPATSIAVFAQEDAFGDAGFHGAAKALRKYGVQEESIVRVGYQRNSLEVEPAVHELTRSHAAKHAVRAVIMVATYRPAAKFMQKLREKRLAPVFSNVSFVGSEALADELRDVSPALCENVIVTQVVPHPESGATAVIRYREQLAKYFPYERPGFVSLEGYLAGRVLVEAFRRAGKDVDTESLIGAFESIHDLDLGIGATVSYGLSEHQASHKVWATQLDDTCHHQVLDMD